MKGVKKHTHSKHFVTIQDAVLKKVLGLPKQARIEFSNLHSGFTGKGKTYESLHEFTYKVERDNY